VGYSQPPNEKSGRAHAPHVYDHVDSAPHSEVGMTNGEVLVPPSLTCDNVEAWPTVHTGQNLICESAGVRRRASTVRDRPKLLQEQSNNAMLSRGCVALRPAEETEDVLKVGVLN
jgi:hypothetical protein